MKKNLRLLCLGLAAATFTCSFAQDDKTSLLKNADMELGLKGWILDGVDVMGKNKKDPSSQVGFHGMNKTVQETWHSDPNNPLGDSYVMQRLKGLPSGTYVFGAYAAAAKQNNRKVVDGKEAGWTNRDSINGVELFANDAVVRVAADNPDMAYYGEVYKWAHSSKFNVAVTLADTGKLKGYLDMGLRINRTNANYVVWDNVTLYYFGDKSEAEALDAMAEIDMENAVAIADTLVDLKMNVDTLEYLEAAIEKAKKETTTAATLWNDSEDLFYNMGLARRSYTDYENLRKHIESATVVMNGTWSKDGMDWYHEDLEDAIEDAEKAYTRAQMNRAELNELRATLSQAAGWMRVDSLYTALDALASFINSPVFTGGPGQYSVAQKNRLIALQTVVSDSLKSTEKMEAEARPQDLYPYIASIYEAIESVKNNPIPTEYSKMPVEFKPVAEGGMKGWIEGTEWLDESKKLVAYNSPMYRFQSKIETFRITVKKNKNGAAHFCLSGLTFYDGNGEVITLTEDNLSTEYDHNTLNPGSEDGGGIAALFDGNHDTYFHSAWQNAPAGEHYLDVILPNGGYDSFSFQMISRSNSNGWDQSHTFPGEMIIDTPKPLRDEMKVKLDEAKALAPYYGTDPGFYVAGEEALEEIAAAIAEAEALIANNAAESEMPAAKERLTNAIYNFDKLLNDNGGNLPINLPEEGKAYRIVSGYPGFFDIQDVEKALTVHVDTMKSLWWENVCADSLQQEFMFEPILQEDGSPYIELVEEGTNEAGEPIMVPYYCYNMKNVYHNLYVDSAFVSNKLELVEAANDTVKLKWLGRGQWNILVKGNALHCGDHNNGSVGAPEGAYGGTRGVSSGICAYPGGLDGASAWYIREYPVMPYAVAVESGEYKSDCIHFDATDSLTLTADAACAFEDLKLYDLFGSAIEFEVVVEGAVAAIKTESVVTACAFAFNNAEGVSTVTLDVIVPDAEVEEEEPADLMAALEEKLEAAAAVAPEVGTGVGQYDDISDYAAVIAAAEAMLAGGAATDDEVKSLIKELEVDSITTLLKNPHMPEAGKYYFIASGFAGFEENLSYNTEFYAKDGLLSWNGENYLDWTHYWQFEPVSVEELKAMGATDTLTTCAFYIKNEGTKEYIGHVGADFSTSGTIPMVMDKGSAAPYKISMLHSGTIIALDDVLRGANDQKRLHFNGHSGGAGKSGNATYWNSGLETASALRIVETEYDMVNIDFTEVENDEKVSAKGTYDLFGRRVVAPSAPGIYIIDGKKKVIK